ncbi:hypothetical protein ACFRAE_16535 [Sphingobacterium sp. HJSM2_6]|uniref:hypothetical protein n=1 Tax=Sphingobacterium sp. HJSM2_6 TaxID=3366264 RepID=UPI003BB9F7B1
MSIPKSAFKDVLQNKSIPGGYLKARLRSMKGEKVGLTQLPLAHLTYLLTNCD